MIKIPFHFDMDILDNLEIIGNTNRLFNGDAVILIVGETGAGKSYYASQVTQVCNWIMGNGTNKEEEIFYDGKAYSEYARANKHKVLVMDESFSAMSSRRTMSKDNFQFGKMLRDVRANGHIHIFLMQDMWDFEKYVVFQRADFMIYVYKKYDPKQRALVPGYYRFYSRALLKRAYIDGWRYHNLHGFWRNSGYGKAVNKLCWDEAKYNKIKSDYIKNSQKEDDKKAEQKDKKEEKILRLQKAIGELSVNKAVTQKELATHFGVNQKTISRWKDIEK